MGDISSAPGYKVNLYYRESIEFGNNLNINPDINIEEKLDFFGSGLNEEATEAQLLSFCAGNNKEYQADQLASPSSDGSDSDSIRNAALKRELQVVIAPNPSDLSASIYFLNGNDGQFDCSVFDITGKQLFSLKIDSTGDKSIAKLNTSTLSNGLYFIVISNKNQRISKKLLIQHQ